MSKYPKTPLTPTMVNKYIKGILENDLNIQKLYITGEVSNVKYHSNGNIYFNIKDNGAQINCLMFKNYQQKMEFKLIEGDKVELIGNIYCFIKMGQYSINVVKVRKVGQGELYQKYLELKNDLEAKGYFNQENKMNIVKYPQSIGVITSDTGAAIRDIITTIKRRYPIAEIVVIPTLVQGKDAHKNIVKNINLAQEYNFDTLIVGRGGGSIEDLWSFNEIDVALAIYECKIPIISAVGHETDFTIADFIADKRAPTPTAAAEMATPDIKELSENIITYKKNLSNTLNQKIKYAKEQMKLIKNNQYFLNPMLNIDNSFSNTSKTLFNKIEIFEMDIKSKSRHLRVLKENNDSNIINLLNNSNTKLNYQKELLDSVNPLNILSKGYAVVQRENKFLKTINDVKVDDKIDIELIDGKIKTKVIKVEEKNG